MVAATSKAADSIVLAIDRLGRWRFIAACSTMLYGRRPAPVTGNGLYMGNVKLAPCCCSRLDDATPHHAAARRNSQSITAEAKACHFIP